MKGIPALLLALTVLPAMAGTDLEGTWQGVWKRPAADARVALVLKHATRHDINAYGATLYLLDEPGLHLTLNQAKLSNGNFTFSGFSGQYSATISAGGDALTGSWTGDSKQEMNFTRADDGAALTATFNVRPTEADLRQYIDTVHTNSILVGDHATGFHLIARVDLFDATKDSGPVPAAYVDIDELWQGPLSWKLTVRDDGGTFTEIDDGSAAYTIGHIPEEPGCCHYPGNTTVDYVVMHALSALFAPFPDELLHGNLAPAPGGGCWDHSIGKLWPELLNNCTGILAGPNLLGTDFTTPVAQTGYRFSPYDFTLRHIDAPLDTAAGYRLDLYDYAPFGTHKIARTIDISHHFSLLARMHVLTLDPAADFSVLSARTPSDATPIAPHSQESLPEHEIVPGKPLDGGPTPALMDGDKRCGICTVSIQLYVDAAGKVAGLNVPDDEHHLITPALLDAVKLMRFSLGYKEGRAVPFDYTLTLWTGIP
jgi:hypothetical protein